MVELVHDHMGERREAGLAARDRFYRGGRLDDLLAGPAGILGPHGADDAPLHRRHVEHLVAVLAQRAQGAAAIGAGAASRFRFDPALAAVKMTGELTDRCRALVAGCRCRCGNISNSGFAFQFLKRQFELLDLAAELLRRLAECHPLKLGELKTQRLDQRIAGRQSRFQLGDPGILVDGGGGLIRHRDPLANRVVQCQKNQRNP
ncbi:hypothetical protein BV96_04063 [Sphingomonas paucimobilis]|nr:hypothetical protein BV96_04063 [Sphingomonas paucimobilis]